MTLKLKNSNKINFTTTGLKVHFIQGTIYKITDASLRA